MPGPDVLLDENDDLPILPVHGVGIDVIMQRARIRLYTHRGDWPLDTRVGFDYLAWFAQKPAQLGTIGALLKRDLEEIDGVTRLSDWSAVQSGDTIEFSAQLWTEYGKLSILVTPYGSSGNISVGFTLGHRSGGIT